MKRTDSECLGLAMNDQKPAVNQTDGPVIPRHASYRVSFRSHASVFQTSSVDGGGPQSNLDHIVATVGVMPWQLPVASFDAGK